MMHSPSALPLSLALAKAGLLLCKPQIMIMTSLFGFLMINQRIFSKAIMLLLFTMIYNAYLKSIWDPILPGWAYMHAAWVFWGYLGWHFRKNIRFMALILLLIYGMVYHSTHNIIELLGAIALGSMSIFLFKMLNKIPSIKNHIFCAAVIISSLALVLLFMIPMPEHTKAELWIAQGALMGMSFGWLCLLSYNQPQLGTARHLLLSFFCLIGLAAIHFSFLHLMPGVSLRNFYFIKGFALILWLVTSKRLLIIYS